MPVRTVLKDPKTGEEKEVVISEDDGIREGVTPAQLAKLNPVFKKGGSTTAGNSSQVCSSPKKLQTPDASVLKQGIDIPY